ncbi:MAG TPA: sulfatase [Bryobacteraceae bacterium]|nr:sulfatase [Bryobacteraceae bacterium]
MRVPPITRRSLLAGAAGALAAQQPQVQPPNVLFVFPDQIRAQEVGYNGGKNVPTPHIDRLASQGVIFTNALSSCPLCTPYRAMLQTGRWPTLSGGMLNFVNLPATGQSMADIFSRAGYDTGFIGKWHLSAGRLAGTLKRGAPPPPLAESEFVPPGPARHGYQYWAAYNFHSNFTKAFYYRDTPERLTMPHYETDSETDMAIDFMRTRAAAGKPFFLTVAPHPPHPPWRAEQTPAGCLERVAKDLYWRPNVKGRVEPPGRDPRYYFAMLANTDDNLGRLTKFLDDSGLADNTIVVFTSDHGEMLGSHGRYNKMVPYAEAVDVPLIVRWPRHIPGGQNRDTLYTPMDHLPTLASLCRLPKPGLADGLDLSGSVLGRKGPEPDAALMMNFVSHWDFPESGTDWPEWRALRTTQHTYVHWLNGSEEFYDNIADPYQLRNLFDGRNAPEAMSRLRPRLQEMLRSSHDEFLPGSAYAEWLTPQRDFKRNALGPLT